MRYNDNKMNKKQIYLDNASTSYVYDDCIDIIVKDLKKNWANPSNLYDISEESRSIINTAKIKIANAINAKPSEIFFTSGASEGNSWAISQRSFTICSPFEHHNYTENANIITISDEAFMSVDYNNGVNYNNYSYAHILVSNETGELFNVRPIFDKARSVGMFTICDCTQAFGNIDLDMKEIGCDMAVFSGHKFHAPKGIGFCYVREECFDKLKPLITGTQQRCKRGGTENVPYIHALGIAAEKAGSYKNREYMETLGRTLTKKIKEVFAEEKIDYITTLNLIKDKSPAIFSFCLKNVESEVIQQILADEGYYVGTGSACATGEMENSKTLEWLDIPPEYIRGHIRVSYSDKTEIPQVIDFAKRLCEVYKEMV